MPARSQISLGVLAGGEGSRLGFADKSVLAYQGQTLLTRALAATGTGFAEVMLSYNGSDPRSARPGMPWVRDLRPGHAGPLAGIESLLRTASAPWLLTLPIDLVNLQPWVIDRLCDYDGGPAAVRDKDGLQPILALWNVAQAGQVIGAALDAGQGAVHALVHQLGMTELDISPHQLGNLNSFGDFD